jgi:hypothetical protein
MLMRVFQVTVHDGKEEASRDSSLLNQQHSLQQSGGYGPCDRGLCAIVAGPFLSVPAVPLRVP